MSDLLAPDTNLALLNATQGRAGQAASAARIAKTESEATEAAREFEAVFIAEMLKPMFQELKTDGPFGGGKGEEVFRKFLLQEYGKLVSQTGGIGVADHVKAKILEAQEASSSRDIAQAPTQEGQDTNDAVAQN